MGFSLGEEKLTCETLVSLASNPNPDIVVTETSWERVKQYRGYVDSVLKSSEKIYGINTGFGFLSDVSIEKDKLQQLQINLIRSHACGVGDFIDKEIVRGLLILRAHTFLLGHSAVTVECIENILQFLKHDILPMIPCKGSVGASGDLAPLSHLALGLIGEGDVWYNNEIVPVKNLLETLGIKQFRPSAKEGLSLINGTQFMTTIAAFAVVEAKNIAYAADAIAAMSLDAIRGTLSAFDDRIHAVRHQVGQREVAKNFLKFFEGDDQIRNSHVDCGKVQDPYSFRCIPQVHGASRDAIDYAERVVQGDLNSVTDNPLAFDEKTFISGGNFHGQPVALVMDFLGIAVAEFGSISERRTEKLTNPSLSGLPAFITKNSGLNSGFMIPHVVSAALVSENKILAHPASVDSIPTSADKEDHVSMGPIAARKCREINKNVAFALSIELLSACQGIDILAPLKPAPTLCKIYDKVREISPYMEEDRSLAKDMDILAKWILANGIYHVCN